MLKTLFPSCLSTLCFSGTGTWPSGRYCILASGDCPSGFERIRAWMKGLKGYSDRWFGLGDYDFGDSNIRCHDRHWSQDDQWFGELTIVTCCKIYS